VFNLDTLMNEKINHRVEFPMDLDLKQYTVNNEDANATECTEYTLAGVVVHLGTAEYGHYFSYIDIKRSEEEMMQKPEAWLEFNDSKIKEFKTKQIEKESFGGTSSDQSVEDEMWGWNNKFNRDNSQNAYILVYEKKVKNPVHLEFQSEEQLLQAQKKHNLPPPVSVTHEDGKIKVLLRYHDLVPFVPEKLRNQVMGDNQ
jgi:ubiquitin carboxyl-terminal hydrolase 34